MAGGSLLDAYEQTPSITPPPDFRRDGIASGSASAFFFHTHRPDSDEASQRAWLGRPWPGVVPGLHEPTAAPLNGFYNRCCPRATPVVETALGRCGRSVRIREQHPATVDRATTRRLPRQSQARVDGQKRR